MRPQICKVQSNGIFGAQLSKCQKLFKTFDFGGACNGVDKKLPPKFQFNILWVVEVRTWSDLLEVVEAVIGAEAEGLGECLIMQSFNDIFPKIFQNMSCFICQNF